MRKLSRLVGLRKLPKLMWYKIGRRGIWTQTHGATVSIQDSPFTRDRFFRANPEQLEGHRIRMTECRKMSIHLSLSKLLSRKYAVIVHLIQPNITQCSNEAYSKTTCVEIVTLLGGSLVKTCTKEKWQTNRCGGLLASSLCGNSVAPGKEMEHLGKHAEPLTSGGHMIAVLMREFMSFMFLNILNIHQPPPTPPGRQSWTLSMSVAHWWMDLLSEVIWAFLYSQAKPVTV